MKIRGKSSVVTVVGLVAGSLGLAGWCRSVLGADAERLLVVEAGQQDRVMAPMSIEAPEGIEQPKMIEAGSGRDVTCQVADGRLWWILDNLPAGQTKTYRLTAGEKAKPIVDVQRDGERKIVVRIAGKHVTTFEFGPDVPRPFFYPLLGPGQTPLTRGFPMVKDVPGEVRDHKHHRSFWVAYGEVNGVDNWSEEKNFGRQVCRKIDRAEGGPVFGAIEATIDWVNHEGKKNLEERRRAVVYAVDGEARIIDLTVIFKATEGNVHFGDTKEGGTISLRVSEELRELGKCGGTVTNSDGIVGAKEGKAWGKRAKWVDYSRTKDKQYGIAVFDTPGNLRYPTHWHVRDYGLFTANPFGVKCFDKNSAETGGYTLENDKELVLRYRLFMHAGDVKASRVAERYEDYVTPPKASWKQ